MSSLHFTMKSHSREHFDVIALAASGTRNNIPFCGVLGGNSDRERLQGKIDTLAKNNQRLRQHVQLKKGNMQCLSYCVRWRIQHVAYELIHTGKIWHLIISDVHCRVNVTLSYVLMHCTAFASAPPIRRV